jgi:transcriptional regulator with XRE-family HTH domain
MASKTDPPIRVTFGRACRDVRLRLDISFSALARQAGISPSYLARVERGLANPSMRTVEDIAAALGLQLGLVVRPPVILAGPNDRRQRDLIHARCSGYVDRRLRAAGWSTLREVPIVDGRYRGWIDLLAFDPTSGTLLIIEIKTRLDDLGAVERQLGWYEGQAPRVAAEQGWTAKCTRSLLLLLASEENERAIRANREVLERAFPTREWLLGTATDSAQRGLALIDPRSRRREWLGRPVVDGRRTPTPFRDFADAAARLAV